MPGGGGACSSGESSLFILRLRRLPLGRSSGLGIDDLNAKAARAFDRGVSHGAATLPG